jgi:hypothetical protein
MGISSGGSEKGSKSERVRKLEKKASQGDEDRGCE